MTKRSLRLSKQGSALAQKTLKEASMSQDELSKSLGKANSKRNGKADSKRKVSRPLVGKFIRGEAVSKANFDLLYDTFQRLGEKVGVLWRGNLISGNSANTTPVLVDVIVLYLPEDESLAEKIGQMLEQEGIQSWIAVRNLLGGRNWQTETKPYIKLATTVCVLIGTNDRVPWSDRKQLLFLKKYRGTAKHEEREPVIIPVLLPGASSDSLKKDSVPRYIKDSLIVDFSQDNFDKNFDKLIEAITGEKQPPKRTKLLTIFGEKIKVVVPGYPIRSSEQVNPSETTIFNKKVAAPNKKYATSNMARKNTLLVHDSDIHIFNLMRFFDKNRLSCRQSIDAKDDINYRDQEKETYILIGLSNCQLWGLTNHRDDMLYIQNNTNKIIGKYFMLPKPKQDDGYRLFSVRVANFKQNSNELQPNSKWKPYTQNEDKKYDYGFLAKFKVENKTVILLAGLTETATQKLVLYVEENLETIFSELKNKKGGDLDPNDPFVVVVQFHKQDEYISPEIEKIVINKITT